MSWPRQASGATARVSASGSQYRSEITVTRPRRWQCSRSWRSDSDKIGFAAGLQVRRARAGLPVRLPLRLEAGR